MAHEGLNLWNPAKSGKLARLTLNNSAYIKLAHGSALLDSLMFAVSLVP